MTNEKIFIMEHLLIYSLPMLMAAKAWLLVRVISFVCDFDICVSVCALKVKRLELSLSLIHI